MPFLTAVQQSQPHNRMVIRQQGFATFEYVRIDITFAYQVFDKRQDWPLVDVTNKSIEESAVEIVSVIGGKLHL